MNHKVRFRPPGIDRDEHVGTIFETHISEVFGVTYYVEDEDGRKYQLAPGSILAPEEVGDNAQTDR